MRFRSGFWTWQAAHGASRSDSLTRPVPGADDIAIFTTTAQDRNNPMGDGATDGCNDGGSYVANDQPLQGQTFLSGSNPQGHLVNAVWPKHAA